MQPYKTSVYCNNTIQGEAKMIRNFNVPFNGNVPFYGNILCYGNISFTIKRCKNAKDSQIKR